jgi:hypothetical protein
VAGGLFIDVKSPLIPLIAGTIGAVILSTILEFFLFNVDYTRTEYLQYEDDEYYYYVKAVPKMSIAQKNVTVKTIREEYPQNQTQNQNYNEVSSDTRKMPPLYGAQGPVGQETISFTGFNQKMTDIPEDTGAPVQKPDDMQEHDVDFESRLEESLKDL